MTPSLRELLLGYLLGALDDREQQLVAARLEHDPVWRRELARMRRQLAPLEDARCDYPPPPGLAAETCRFVFASADKAPRPKAAKSRPAFSPARVSLGWIERLRRADVGMGAAVAVVFLAMLLPALVSSRFQARLIACQNNLRELGLAMTRYSQANHDLFPSLPAAGPLRTPGVFAPILAQAGLLRDKSCLTCPGASRPDLQEVALCTLDELEQWPAAAVERIRPSLGGSYGYHPGHLEEGRYRPTRNLRRFYFAVLADMPSLEGPGHLSLNHSGRGQNVWFEDGHVRFLSTPRAPEFNDDFFVNADGRLDLGVHRDDSAILPAVLRPSQGVSNAVYPASLGAGLP